MRTRWQSLSRRRLLFEQLERRDLLTVMRVVDWNTFNGPNNATDDANFQTVFQAIGNETVQGNTQRIDILALQETDPPGTGNDSIGRVVSILDSLYPSTTYASVVTPVDGGGDSTGIVYDTSSVSLIDSVQVGAGTLTHNIERAEFRPIDTNGTSDFYVYSIHLKSGDGGTEVATRGNEAAILRADADSLGEGAQVLFVGDFNMQASSEAAYTNFVSAGPGQLQDVADAPGHWNNNPAFKSLHTQDPQTAMDDRFDIQFATGEFFDGVGVDYVTNSYHVFANNGTHTVDAPITTGTGASPEVLNALVAASDHLPVVADYQVIDTPNVRVSETLGSTKVVEGGLYDTYHVVLDTIPTANVTVTVMPDSQVDVGNGAGVAAQLTFTPADALTPQTIIVHAADDAVEEGDHAGLITHTSSSADPAYDGLSVAGVNVSILDNDAPRIVIDEIDADQSGTDTKEFVELYDGGVGNASLDGYFLVFFNGADSNNGSYESVSLAGQHTNANGFFVLGDSGLTPPPDLAFSSASNNIQQGPDGIGLYKFTAAELESNPNPFPNDTSPTTSHLRDAVVYTTGPGGTAADQDLIDALNPGNPQINENQNGGSSGETQSLSRVPDGGASFDTSLYTAQTPTPGTFNYDQPGGVLILQSAGRIDVEEGGATDSYQLALLTIPTANVQITVDPDNQIDLGAGPGGPIVLTFTSDNALIPQTITVTAVDDTVVEGDHTSVITNTVGSTDAKYNGLLVSNVVANIIDNDLPGDYNANGSVDAADYVLWRKTLGSTTNLVADGSGPTAGAPNGVVDQFDYDYWRSNFGNVDPLSGAGSDAGLGSTQLAVTSDLREPVTTVSTESNPLMSPQLSNEASDGDNSHSAVFATATFGTSPTFASRPSTSEPNSVMSDSSAATSLNAHLLLFEQAPHAPRQTDLSLINSYDSPNAGSDAVDHVFASLAASDLAGSPLFALL
ncbi:MAG TPA: hypothetical protein VFW73_12500 [Lacipirellulaceae bacterium]|nr:hypothetical protein [Lacipirellulaceae bacterium]